MASIMASEKLGGVGVHEADPAVDAGFSEKGVGDGLEDGGEAAIECGAERARASSGG